MEKTYIPTAEAVKLLGRTYLRNDILWCAYSATGVEFVARAKTVSMTVYADGAYNDPANRARIAVFVDGKVKQELMLDMPQIELMLQQNDEEKVHVIRVVKLSESAMSTVGFGKITVTDGDILPTAERELFIEFIGDSITCGYGVEDENPEHHFVTSTENVTKAFAYKTAQLLDADHSLVSFSGYGVLSGYTDSGIINEKELLPPYYEKMGFSYAKSGEKGKEFRIHDVEWDFSGRQPQFVVINLGTNDMSYTGSDVKKQKKYQDRYIQLVKKVREKYPDTYILCVLGIMGDMLYPALLEAVNQYRIKNADVRIETMPFEPIRVEEEGYVADFHPTEKTHTRCAEQLAERIREISQREYGIYPGEKVLALTFDDGPNTTTTLEVLHTLKKQHALGTFFLIGQNINEQSKASVLAAVEAGCEIENHSVTHSVMNEMPMEAVIREIEETNEAIRRITGKYPHFFRPPYIAINDEMLEQIPLVMICGHGCDDWDASVPANIRAQRVLAQIRSGQIILLHDMEGNEATVKALEIIITRAKGLGYSFLTLQELFDARHVVPHTGNMYSEAENR